MFWMTLALIVLATFVALSLIWDRHRQDQEQERLERYRADAIRKWQEDLRYRGWRSTRR